MSIPIPNHLGGSYEQGDSNTIMLDCWGYLICKYDLKSMIDVGCGFGHSLDFFSRHLVSSRGFDGDPNTIDRGPMKDLITLHDFTKGPVPIDEDAVFDLGWSAEFLEHVEGVYMPNYMALFQKCKHVCLTHGEPGQPGHYHVTLIPDSEWIAHFTHYGFRFDPEETALLRKTDRWHSGWGRRTLMMFHNTRFSK